MYSIVHQEEKMNENGDTLSELLAVNNGDGKLHWIEEDESQVLLNFYFAFVFASLNISVWRALEGSWFGATAAGMVTSENYQLV